MRETRDARWIRATHGHSITNGALVHLHQSSKRHVNAAAGTWVGQRVSWWLRVSDAGLIQTDQRRLLSLGAPPWLRLR